MRRTPGSVVCDLRGMGPKPVGVRATTLARWPLVPPVCTTKQMRAIPPGTARISDAIGGDDGIRTRDLLLDRQVC